MRAFSLAGTLLLLVVVAAQAKIYKWTDRDGRVYFTDNIWTVPPEYRDQAEEKASTPSPRQFTPAAPHSLPSSLAGNTLASKHYTVPLFRVGNAMFVEVTLNGFLKSRLLVDTGAAITVISTAIARQLALDLDDAAVIPLQSASGTFLAPLTKIRSISVGNATVRDVEVIIHDITPRSSGGLLGMSFLDNFQVTMHAAAGTMTLTALTGVPGEVLYGGHPEDWWRRKFRFYRRQIALLEAQLDKQPSPKFAKTLRYFQTELATLERKASHAAVPRHWRY
jgi:clan AA aspartic protease (TIGR02281 family)